MDTKVLYDSNNYYIEFNNYDYDYDYDSSNQDFNNIKSYLNNYIKNDYYIVQGTNQLWNKTVYSNFYLLEDIDKFFTSISSDIDHIVIEENYNDTGKEFYISGKHHDGVNNYCIKPLRKLSKQDLLDILLNNCETDDCRNEMNSFFKENYGKSINAAKKSELKECIIEMGLIEFL